jgi:hypothetical protein
VLLLDQVQWKDGWPLIKTSSPSTGSDKPVFK